MRWMELLLSLACLLTGCISSPPGPVAVPVTSFEDLHVLARESSFRIKLGRQDVGIEVGPCHTLRPEAVARLDGRDVTIVNRGGKVGEFDGANECDAPEIIVDERPAGGSSLLELSDSLGGTVCDLPDLWAERRATPIPELPPGPWQLRSRQQLTVQWFPASDLRIWDPTVEFLGMDSMGRIDSLIEVRDEAVFGDLLSFTVPSLTSRSYLIEFRRASLIRCRPQTVTVEIVSAFSKLPVSHPVAVVP
jgi:hypothetical protein